MGLGLSLLRPPQVQQSLASQDSLSSLQPPPTPPQLHGAAWTVAFFSHLSLMTTGWESAAATHDTYAQAHLVWDSFSFSFKGESNLCLYLSFGTNSQVSDQPSQAARQPFLCL